MIFRSKKLKTQDERLDRVRLEVLRAVKVSEEEVDAVASSPDLYDRLRSRITAEQRRRAGERALADSRHAPTGLGLSPQLSARRSWGWALAAAAICLLLGTAILYWLPKPSPEPRQVARSASPQNLPSPTREVESSKPPSKREPETERPERMTVDRPLPNQSRPVARRRQTMSRTNGHAGEVATDFLPLTFTADAPALESGHVVRVKIPRSALVSFGLPMNLERAGELVKADVVIGDDGLARAIRFVQ